MDSHTYLTTLKAIGWLEQVCWNSTQYRNQAEAVQYIVDRCEAGDAGELLLTEGCLDEEELYDTQRILRDMVRLTNGDLTEQDMAAIVDKGVCYHEATALFADVNHILQQKGIAKSFYILPRVDQMVFYVYKPIELFQRALDAGVIAYEKQAATDTEPTPDIDAILFDLDGTLIDTAPDFIRIIKKMCDKYQRPYPPEDAIRAQVSAGSYAMVRLMFADEPLASPSTPINDAELQNYRQEFLDTYEADICVDSCLFAGFAEMLQSIEKKCDKPWGIVTNKPRYLAEILLAKLNLDQRCAVLVCPDDVMNTKPDPEPLFLASGQLGVRPEHCVYVGDHIRDIQAGNAAGMITVLASYGYIPPEDKDLQVWQADFIIDSPQQMSEFVTNWLC